MFRMDYSAFSFFHHTKRLRQKAGAEPFWEATGFCPDSSKILQIIF